MYKKGLILFLAMMLAVIIPLGMEIQGAQGSGSLKSAKQLTAGRLISYQPRIGRDQAINIALNAHKRAMVLSVELYRSIYTIRLKTFLGKRTVKIGANTGRILYDKLDWTEKSK